MAWQSFSSDPSINVWILPNNSVMTNFCVLRCCDPGNPNDDTHRLSITDQPAHNLTRHTTSHSQSLGHLKLECPVKTTSELGWGARNPKPTENAASVSPSILVKLRSRGSPQCFSCYWPQSHNGSDSNLKTQLEEWAPLHIMVTVTCTYDV